MNTKQAENLRTLIRHMESQACWPVLDMTTTVSECGSPACALGAAKLLPRLGKLLERYSMLDEICEANAPVFGLKQGDGMRLFNGGPGNAWARCSVTAAEWAIEARKVLAEHGYSMDDAKPVTFEDFMVKVLQPPAELMTASEVLALYTPAA